MAEEPLHINQENATRFPFLGSPAAQAQAGALGQAGTCCLKALYSETMSKQSQFREDKGTQSGPVWNELQTHTNALETALHEAKTPIPPSHVLGHHNKNRPPLSRPSTPVARRATGAALLASSAGQGIPPVVWSVLELEIRREQDDHETFMRALSPDTKVGDLLAQGSTEIREHLLADVKRAIAGPLPIEDFHSETARDEGMFNHPSLIGLDEVHRADTAWEQQTNTWRRGLPLSPMLACSEYTDSEDPQIVQTARHLLTMPRLANILQQRFPDGTSGDHALVHGPDGSFYTFNELAFHPTYCLLMERDELWNTLHSPEMDRLLDQAHQSQPLVSFSTVDLQRLAMAQRIVSVVIHHAVRDSIHYLFGGWQQTAVEVLRARQGSCSSSANLAVALARAARVPAGAIRLHVETPEYFGRAAIPNAVGGRTRVSVHYQVGWITLQSAVDGGLTWQVVRSDPSDEFEIGAGLEHFNCPRSRVTHFDGSHDCVLLFPPEEVFDDVGPLAIIDPLLRKQKPLIPSISQRLELLRAVHARGPVAGIQQLASQITQSSHQGRYDLVAQSYKAKQESLLEDPLTVAAFPGKVAQQLKAFLNHSSTLTYMMEKSVPETPLWADRFLAFAKSQGMNPDHLPHAASLTPRLFYIVRSLRAVLHSVPEADRAELPAAFVACTQHQRVLQISPSQTEWTRRLGNVYQFMDQCYPDNSDSHHGPRASPYWLHRSIQERYLNFIRSEASAESMQHPASSALSFLLGKDASQYQDPQGQWHKNIIPICNNAGISPEQVYQIAQFHTHLLSDVATATWERYCCFMRQHAEGIRCSTDCAVEFEAWFHRRDPILAALHRDDLAHDPLYPKSVSRYLLPRTVAKTTSLIRTALSEFIELIETQPVTIRPRTNAEMDSLLHGFLRERTVVSMEAVVGERRGGWLKPYGVLYALWKIYILPLEEAIGVAKDLVRCSQEQSYRSEQDWLGEVAKSYPYATESPRWKAVAML
ncbi:uncharacterized protein KD926_001217 [Aspergillus affinis]|uniref:uncharacterized protein n=1 Tax=Aspergillus affinis TaxID=1070780 RepID=UPI0022FEA1B6|nr:uncharacterized protein KD926_001217 [Aspergillus affinis]KAI9036902.1 hypothetical protein KD926_001217 [Aspergillus affinis]